MPTPARRTDHRQVCLAACPHSPGDPEKQGRCASVLVGPVDGGWKFLQLPSVANCGLTRCRHLPAFAPTPGHRADLRVCKLLRSSTLAEELWQVLERVDGQINPS